ncbi:MAG: hypothetical protein JWO89_1014 [Verrucomicrobiaceae bacterium]|nr:hypothetical protein [Verrucomicrobiaceae bacterium]
MAILACQKLGIAPAGPEASGFSMEEQRTNLIAQFREEQLAAEAALESQPTAENRTAILASELASNCLN